MSDIAFEILKEKDVEKSVDMVTSSLVRHGVSEPINREVIKQMIFSRNVLTLIAKKERKILGLISGTTMFTPNINILSVIDEGDIGKYVGELLISRFVEEIKKNFPKNRYVTVTLTTDNTKAISEYSSKGFVIKGFVREGIEEKDVVILAKDTRRT